MTWEEIGTCPSDGPQGDRGWCNQCCEMALSYIRFCVGSMPRGCELRIKWRTRDPEHEEEWSEIDTDLERQELPKYPSIGVSWSDPHDEPQHSFISVCEALLSTFDEAIRWDKIQPSAIGDIIDLVDT